MKTQKTSLEGVVVFEPVLHRDSRGLFFEAYKEKEFAKIGLPTIFLQDNVSQSKRGVIRGLHYQRDPMAQGKLIRCVKGTIFDVAVDLRVSSPTFGKIESIVLTDENHLALYIPPGFAHGFQAMTEDTIIHYKCTEVYSKEHDTGIYPLDESLGINWPLPISEISDKDKTLPRLKDLSANQREQLLFR